MYSKTKCKIKTADGLSPEINNLFGVNQGGTLSPNLFRKYLADMSDYLHKVEGVAIDTNTIIAHILWADDLILFADTADGLQKQMNGLHMFCCKNKMVVNEMKTKVMVFGNPENKIIMFNNKEIECVNKYKYLGVMINSVKRCNGDIFREHSNYIKEQEAKPPRGPASMAALIIVL